MNYRTKTWLTEKALRLAVWLQRDSNYISHCKREVPEWFEDEGPDRWIADGTVQLLAVLSHQGHSGGSIYFALNFFQTMAKFNPWGPLTGEDSEWMEVGDGYEQNTRLSSVFRKNGEAHDIDGRVFRDPDGVTFTSSESRLPITFPYTKPEKPEIVDVDSEGVPLNAS